jgi:hypothetical protein
MAKKKRLTRQEKKKNKRNKEHNEEKEYQNIGKPVYYTQNESLLAQIRDGKSLKKVEINAKKSKVLKTIQVWKSSENLYNAEHSSTLLKQKNTHEIAMNGIEFPIS